MNQADQINEDVQGTLQALCSVQDKKKILLAAIRQTLSEYLEMKQGALKQRLQEYFIYRNNKLESAVNEVQDSLKNAYEARGKIIAIRDQFIGVFNASTKPPLTSQEGDFLCCGYGDSDFKKIFSVTEECFGQLNNIQEHYDSIVSEVLEAIPHLVDSKLQGLEMAVYKRNCQVQQWADLKTQEIQEHLAKIRSVLETMETMKCRMESLLQVINGDKAAVGGSR
ncbi:uncharacterized protein LOC135199357 [Macrobrachium nipponense]|uniref:uncharacterized protein LOC135199357 n=1 Tax=Macrobrachium nipponense TaxID=159736 RepID=UPI0030C7E3EC